MAPARTLLLLCTLLVQRPCSALLAAEKEPVEKGTCASRDTLLELTDDDPATDKLLARYNFPADPFPWMLRKVMVCKHFELHHLTFPSPTKFFLAEPNTVHAEYYLPHPGRPRGPAAVVLHILDGRFLVARMICRQFARSGVPCLMVQMPYYGQRRPAGRSLRSLMVGKPERMFETMDALVRDVRRAACWLQKRPEVDPGKLGIVGVSLGAIGGALIVGVDPRFNRNVLVLGGGGTARILWHAPETRGVRERLVELGYTLETLREAAVGVDPLSFARRVDPRTVLMLNATHDKTIPRESTLALWNAMGKPALRWHPAGHYSMSVFIPLILPQAFSFVRDLR